MKNFDNKIIKSISILFTGSLLGQIIVGLTAPVMTRLYSVEAIGVYTYITSIVYFVLPIINCRYELAIITEKNDEKVLSIVKLCMIMSIIIASTCTVPIIFLLKNSKSIGNFTYIVLGFIVLFLLLNGYINIVSAHNNREGLYKVLSKANVVRSVIMAILVILFGLLKYEVLGLILATTLSLIACLKEQSVSIRKFIKKILYKSIDDILSVAREYKSLPIYSAPAALMNSFAYSAVNLCIEDLYGIEVLAYYSLSFRVLGIPLGLISGNVSKVFFEQAAKEYNACGNFTESFNKSIKILLFFSIPIMLVLYYMSPWVCSVVFGENWAIAGDYIKIMALMFGVRFVASPLSTSVLIVKSNRLEIIGQCMLFSCLIGSYYCARFFQLSVYDFLLYYSLGNTLIYLIWIYVLKMISKGIRF